jgi:hypothetical protein
MEDVLLHDCTKLHIFVNSYSHHKNALNLHSIHHTIRILKYKTFIGLVCWRMSIMDARFHIRWKWSQKYGSDKRKRTSTIRSAGPISRYLNITERTDIMEKSNICKQKHTKFYSFWQFSSKGRKQGKQLLSDDIKLTNFNVRTFIEFLLWAHFPHFGIHVHMHHNTSERETE